VTSAIKQPAGSGCSGLEHLIGPGAFFASERTAGVPECFGEMSETDGKHAWPAAAIQKPAGPVETRLLRQDGFELG
jgi:hypothetical protein